MNTRAERQAKTDTRARAKRRRTGRTDTAHPLGRRKKTRITARAEGTSVTRQQRPTADRAGPHRKEPESAGQAQPAELSRPAAKRAGRLTRVRVRDRPIGAQSADSRARDRTGHAHRDLPNQRTERRQRQPQRAGQTEREPGAQAQRTTLPDDPVIQPREHERQPQDNEGRQRDKSERDKINEQHGAPPQDRQPARTG